MSFARLKSPARLSLRLTLWHSLLFMGAAVALLALTYLLLRQRADETEHYVIESRLNQYASEYKRGGLDAVRHLATLRRGRAQQAFFVRVGDQKNDTVFLRHAEDWSEFGPDRLIAQPLPPPGPRSWQTLPSADGTKLTVGAERLPDGGVLQVGKANEELNDLLADYRRASLMMFLFVVPVSFVVGALITSKALRPVQHLTSVVQEIVETDRLDARVPSGGTRDELDSLVQLFNKMLSRIEWLVRGMRESLDHVAHDLRTPLTRLRHKAQSFIEMDQDRQLPADCPGCRVAVEKFADCVEEADRVNTVLSTLVDIAEAEARLVKAEVTPVALEILIRDAIESYAEFAQESGVSLTSSVPPGLIARMNPTALFRVITNLLENAIKYSKEGGKVRIEAERRDANVEVHVVDNGIGVPPEDLPRVWDRLFRSDRSRSQRGMGLGLSLVRALVESNQGEVGMESAPGSGTTVRFTLPLASLPSGEAPVPAVTAH